MKLNEIIVAAEGDENRNLSTELLLGLYQTMLWMSMMMIPTRNLLNKCCHYKTSSIKYLNIAEFTLHAFERTEDRPNTLLWILIQIIFVELNLEVI